MMLATFFLLQATVSPELFRDPAAPICYREQKPVAQLREVIVIRDREIAGRKNNFKYNVNISGERIVIMGGNANPQREFDASYFYNGKTNLDVDVFGAIFQGELVIYWEETLRHNGKKFGLVKIDNGSLSPFCVGLTAPVVQH